MDSLWQQAKEHLKNSMDEKSFTMWVKPLKVLYSNDEAICIGCPNKFSKNWLQENYYSLFHNMLSQAGLNGHKLLFDVLPPKNSKEKNNGGNGYKKQLPLPNMPKRFRAGGKYLNSRFTFDKFVVGRCNEFAYSVSRALAGEAECPYNSLLLYAETGLGKSHLTQAIGNEILKKKPDAKVLYLTTEDFTNEMITSLKNNRIGQFKEKYRSSCDVLLLEELHFLSGKDKTQTELGYTLDSLFNDEKKVIFTSPLMPEHIPGMKKMLASRLTSSIISSIERPEFHIRLEIIKQKTKERNIPLPEDVACFLAENLSQDIRQLEGCIDSLNAGSLFLNRKIDMGLVKEIIKQMIPARKNTGVKDIQNIVCKYFKADLSTLKSKSRKKAISYPRSIAIYLCRRYTDKSLEYIGKCFNRNHSTVLYDEEKIRKAIKKEDNTRREVEFLSRRIEDNIS